jgi:hypothetical protein
VADGQSRIVDAKYPVSLRLTLDIKKTLMVITKKYESFGTLSTKTYGRKLLGNFRQNIGRVIDSHRSADYTSVLTSSDILPYIASSPNITTYNSLYSRYLSVIDVDELTKVINEFILGFEKQTGFWQLKLIKSYFFAFLMDDWCERVEHAFKIFESEKGRLFYVGQRAESDYKIYNGISHSFYPNTSVRRLYCFSDDIISRLGQALNKIKKARELELNRFLNGFSEETTLPTFCGGKKIIVIGILEGRRITRIAELHRELTLRGYEVVLFSALHKRETMVETKKFPELLSSLVIDNSLITKAEATKVLNESKSELLKLCKSFRNSGELQSYTYRGVPLIDICWEDLENVILMRGMQVAINTSCIQKFMQYYPVAGFIGMDNSVATSVWINECNQKDIPTFFHYYNAALSPIVYKLLLESFQPKVWLLGGKKQLEFFKRVDPARNYQVTGDMFADTIVKCDKEAIRKVIKDKFNIRGEEKVVVLVSSYIVADFTIERKKMLFQSVALSAAQLDMQLVVKAHPNESLETLLSEMDSWDVKAPIFQTESIRDVFIAADVVCMYFSEAAQQAMLVGVPVISLIPEEMVDDFDKHWNYYSSGAVEHVPLGSSPLSAIKGIVFDESIRAKLLTKASDYTMGVLGKNDGNNASRFAEKVQTFIK